MEFWFFPQIFKRALFLNNIRYEKMCGYNSFFDSRVDFKSLWSTAVRLTIRMLRFFGFWFFVEIFKRPPFWNSYRNGKMGRYISFRGSRVQFKTLWTTTLNNKKVKISIFSVNFKTCAILKQLKIRKSRVDVKTFWITAVITTT